MKWLGEIISEKFDAEDKIQMEREYSELRTNAMLTLKCINQTIPYSLVQLVLFLTYLWLSFMPMSMYHKMTSGLTPFVSVTFLAPVATTCVSLCFQTILSIIIALGNPTGDDLDDVDPEALLIQTDEDLLVFLGGQEDNEGTISHAVRMTTMDVKNMRNSAEELDSEDFKRQDSMNCDAHEGIELQRRIPHDTEPENEGIEWKDLGRADLPLI